MFVNVYMSQASSKGSGTSLHNICVNRYQALPLCFFVVVVVVVVVVVGARGEPGNEVVHNACI